jgi:hypothetical protein
MAERSTRSNSQVFSIVVVGAMNPSIHHPYWYRLSDVISQAEADAALKNEDTICMPPAAHFRQASEWEISCQVDRWEIKTSREDQTRRILEIAAKVFTLLDHTPVSAAGINAIFTRQASVPDVAKLLADAVSSLQLGFQGEGSPSAEVSQQWAVKGRRWTVWVSPVLSAPSFVQVRTNAHYHEFGELLGTHFDLADILRRHFEDDLALASSQLDRVMEALQRRRQHGN